MGTVPVLLRRLRRDLVEAAVEPAAVPVVAIGLAVGVGPNPSITDGISTRCGGPDDMCCAAAAAVRSGGTSSSSRRASWWLRSLAWPTKPRPPARSPAPSGRFGACARPSIACPSVCCPVVVCHSAALCPGFGELPSRGDPPPARHHTRSFTWFLACSLRGIRGVNITTEYCDLPVGPPDARRGLLASAARPFLAPARRRVPCGDETGRVDAAPRASSNLTKCGTG